MGYAETVQLITGLVIWLASLFGYLGFSLYYKKINRRDLLPFLMFLMIASSCIGTHQVFEFLALRTGSEVIYKIGLMISLSGMVLYLMSLEKFYNRNLYVKPLAALVVIVAIYLSLKPVEFTVLNFHLEHHSIFLWSLMWFVLFIYWNACIVFERKYVSKFIPRSLSVMFLLFSMTISFLASAVYSILDHYKNDADICITYPSVWCTFGVMQVIFLPFFLYFLPHKMKKAPPYVKIQIKNFFIYIFISIAITIILTAYLVSTGCFNVGFMLR